MQKHHDVPQDMWVLSSEVLSHPFSVDPTFNFWKFEVMPFTYKHLFFEIQANWHSPSLFRTNSNPLEQTEGCLQQDSPRCSFKHTEAHWQREGLHNGWKRRFALRFEGGYVPSDWFKMFQTFLSELSWQGSQARNSEKRRTKVFSWSSLWKGSSFWWYPRCER